MAPREEIGIDALIVMRDMPNLLTVRCDQSVAEQISLRWYRAVPLWRLRVLQAAMLVGLGTAVYWMIVVVQFLVLRTPAP